MADVSKAIQVALQQLRRERAMLDRQIAALKQAVWGHGRRATRTKQATPPRRTMSAAQRKAVSARMKRYWAARRKTKQA